MEARSAAGLSPLSNTRTATVPQNEEEEEPVALRQETATTLVSNLGNEVGWTSYPGWPPLDSDASVAYSGTDSTSPPMANR